MNSQVCEICGTTGFEDERLLHDMCSVMYHRGPDDDGTFLDAGVGLGHQSVHNVNESVWVVYNGETYNHVELRDGLESESNRFYTSSDTEVLVHLYEEHGVDLVRHMRGMFAFTIWDSSTKTLMLARDRLGIKPLYCTMVDGKLLFASEIKSILQSDEVNAAVNATALHDYLTLRHTLADDTMFASIKKLLPRHVMMYHEGEVFIRQYWDVPVGTGEIMSEDHNVKNLRRLLEYFVRMRLMSEVKEHGFLFAKSVFSEEDKDKLYADSLKGQVDHDSFERATDTLFGNTTQTGFLDRMMYTDTKSYLVDHILLETDKLTMSSLIEAQVPIIDHKVVEFAASILPQLKLKGMTEKYILKKVGQDILPPSARNRRKRPFRIPINT